MQNIYIKSAKEFTWYDCPPENPKKPFITTTLPGIYRARPYEKFTYDFTYETIWNEKFHIWNWNFTCEIKISRMNYRISYMKPNNSYVKTYMWNRITYEFLDSYMKFLYVKTNHIWNLYVKTYHIWNPQFIYEILYVKTNHIWNLYVKTNHIWNWNSICKINHILIKSPIHIWISIREQIVSEILNSYTYMFYIIEILNLYLTEFLS